MPELELTPQEVDRRIREGDPIILVDVREPEEYAFTRVEGTEFIPMPSVPAELQRLETFADEHAVVVFCHHGVRSLQVAAWLREHGVENCFSMAGGIDRWSREVDPGVRRY